MLDRGDRIVVDGASRNGRLAVDLNKHVFEMVKKDRVVSVTGEMAL